MLTNALDDTKKAYFKPVIDEMATDAEDLGLGENGAYALAWIKLWLRTTMSRQTMARSATHL
mgnify:CR=1 FL=1